ncbi:phosphodiester glycosidase family protein [Acinetobacter soli]|uniref:phosphodiester glycosidase family protein n=1 Tax=Acinetobacter soli TaxID=487316 RepID=UPI00125028C3|nr:phosphodiester glycosidase family protein [Acinetobacter soli]
MRFKKKQMIYIFSFVFMCLSVPAFAKLVPTYREIHSQLGVDAIVIQVSDLSKLSLALNDPDTLKKYGSFSALQNSLPACQHLVFAMNAGMYHRDREPVGLYIEANQQRTALNTQDGYGNFFLQPNGVLAWNDREAIIKSTSEFTKRAFHTKYATQSGPMLVINGNIHSKFLTDSDSLKIRNAVGVKDNQLYFVITRNRVNFYALARLFKDELQIDNALYLDGSISSLYWAAQQRNDHITQLGPLLAWIDPAQCHFKNLH